MPYCVTIARATVGGLLDVVGRTGGRVVEDDLLGDATAEHVGELVEHLVARRGVLVLVGQHHRVAEGATARQDRDLVHRVGVRQRRRDQGVAALVVGGDLLLLLVHQTRVRFCGPAMTRSIASSRAWLSISLRSLRAVSSAASLSTFARSAPVKPGVRRATASRSTSGASGLPLRVHLEDLRARPFRSGRVDGDLAVEAAGAQQRRVEDVGPVRGGDQDDAAA